MYAMATNICDGRVFICDGCIFICDGREFICDGHEYMRWLHMHVMPKRIGDGDVLLVEATDKECQLQRVTCMISGRCRALGPDKKRLVFIGKPLSTSRLTYRWQARCSSTRARVKFHLPFL